MVPAFVSCDGRSLSAQVAVSVACHLAATAGSPVTLLRVIETGGASLHDSKALVEGLRAIEFEGEPTVAAFRLDKAMSDLGTRGHALVLDLPWSFLSEPALRGRSNVIPIVPVGNSMIEVAMVERSLARLSDKEMRSDGDSTHRRRPHVLLCGAAGDRHDGRSLFPELRLPTLPVSMPRFRGVELDRIARLEPSTAASRRIEAVLAALREIFEAKKLERHPERSTEPNDVSGEPATKVAETLRSLADDLEDYAVGLFPTSGEIEGAPVIDDWTPTLRARPAVAGVVSGHPLLPPGRRKITSEAFVTDGASYVRTCSRLYRLGRPGRLKPDASDKEEP